jgi:hypothetical protein
MSWHARRYLTKNWHHVPPQNPAKTTPFKIRVSKKDHAAYHQLFANAGSFEQCCEILWRDWWNMPSKNFTVKDIAILAQMGIKLPVGG